MMNQNLDKYFSKRNVVYNSSVDKSSFDEICTSFGLRKIDENTYQMPKTEINIVSSIHGIYAIPSNNKYFEQPIYEHITGMYSFYYQLVEYQFLPDTEYVNIGSLMGLIMFLEFMTYYERWLECNNSEDKMNELKVFQKKIDKYKSLKVLKKEG